MDKFSKNDHVTNIKGRDGVIRQKLEIKGGYRNKNGVFEYIKEPNGNINHRLFKPDQ